MTADELGWRMSSAELVEQYALDMEIAAERKKAEDKANAKK